MKLSYAIVFLLLPVLLLAGDYSNYEHIKEKVEIEGKDPITLVLDVDAGEVQVEKHALPGVILVDVTYDEQYYSVNVDYNKRKNKVRIHVDREHWNKMKDDNGKQEMECIVYLPPDIEMYMETKLKAGELDMVLGGLDIVEFDLNMWAGEANIDFDEPNLHVMEMLDVDTRVGEFNLHHLGNARFKRADINGGIGEIHVDFTGAMEPDARSKVDLDIGEATVVLPSDIGVQINVSGITSFMSAKNIDRDFIKRGSHYYSENYQDMDSRMYMRITPGLGELNIEME